MSLTQFLALSVLIDNEIHCCYNLCTNIFFFSRENDYQSQTHWKVDRNIITQISNGKALSNSPYVFGKLLFFFFCFSKLSC